MLLFITPFLREKLSEPHSPLGIRLVIHCDPEMKSGTRFQVRLLTFYIYLLEFDVFRMFSGILHGKSCSRNCFVNIRILGCTVTLFSSLVVHPGLCDFSVACCAV